MIKKLTIQNIKKISFVEIENPDKSLIEIVGKNAQGKSSILQAIEMALGGGKYLGEMPLKEGEERGHVIVETDDVRAERRIHRDAHGNIKTQLIVYDRQGDIVNRPQEYLNNLLGSSTYNPMEMVNTTPAERVEMLKESFGINFSELDKERGRAYAERTEINREQRILEGQLLEYPAEVPEDPPRTMDAVLEEKKKIDEHFARERDEANLRREERTKCDHLRLKISQLNGERSSLKIEIEKLEMRLKAAKEKLETTEKEIGEMSAALKGLEEKITVGYKVPASILEKSKQLEAEISTVALANREMERFKLGRKLHDEYHRKIGLANDRTKRIKEIDLEKQNILRSVNFPIEGVSFGEDDILFNGVPFTNASLAERIKLVVSINAAMNPSIRIMRIEEGSSLDEKSIEELRKFAEENNFQFWIEVVDRKDKNNANMLIIEDGKIL